MVKKPTVIKKGVNVSTKKETAPKKVTSPTTPKVDKDVEKRLQKVVESCNKKYGDNAVIKGFPKKDSGDNWYDIVRFSTGIPSLDVALGGGISIGGYTERQGAFSCLQTSTQVD